MHKAHVLSGLDHIDSVDHLLRNRRIGLMTNPTGVDHSLRSGIDILHRRYGLSALFGCEHGVRGDIQAGDPVATYVDEQTGVTVYSVYGDTKHLTDEMLQAFDVLVFDMQARAWWNLTASTPLAGTNAVAPYWICASARSWGIMNCPPATV